jgi:hypothetical protein
MITKVFLNAQTHSEGFIYALPAVLLFVVLFQGIVPQYFERSYPNVYFVRTLASILIVLIFIAGLKATTYVYQSRFVHVGSGSNLIISREFLWFPPNAQTEEITAFLQNG